MKASKNHSARTLICIVTLLTLPAAFASNGAKFKVLDTDNDGRVSRAEHTAGALLMFDRLDANRDGVLNGDEMEGCHQLKNANKLRDKKDEKPAAEKVAMSDPNADVQLTRAENKAAADKMFTQLDTDHDGYLSKDECEACLTASLKKDK